MAVKLTQSEVPSVWWGILPVAVWVVYTLDHLLDSLKSMNRASNQRHQFHFRYFWTLFSIMIILGGIALFLSLFFFRIQVMWIGLSLSILVVLYFGLLNFLPEKYRKFLPKELFIAIVYVLGIWFVPIFYSNQSLSVDLVWLLVIFVTLTWAEGAMTSLFEYDTDIQDGHHSFATFVGLKKGKLIVIITLEFSLVLLSLLAFLSTNPLMKYAAMILMVINLGLLSILLLQDYFKQQSRYRSWGECLFFLPVLLLLF
ncbi:MAG: hypothetical protein WC341_06250 [Bacteroidales bacterium]